jgi:hypothetical protein
MEHYMSSIEVKELSHPAGEVLKIAAGKTLDLRSQGSVTMPAGSVLQVINIVDTDYLGITSNSYVDIHTLTISNVQAGSSVTIDASINHLIENRTYATFAVFKGATLLTSNIHDTGGMTSWVQPLNPIYTVDSSPSVGTNVYTIKCKSSSGEPVFYNYNSDNTQAKSYYKLMEIAQ